MKRSLLIDLERQSVHAGDEVRGSISVVGGVGGQDLWVGLHGEEIVAANSIVGSLVCTHVDEVKHLEAESAVGGPFPFSLQVPADVPPSYASRDMRCEYFVKAGLPLGLAREVHQRMHLTVLPPIQEDRPDEPHDLALEEAGARLELHVDCTTVASGESVRGRLLLNADEAVPERLSFWLGAIEEPKDVAYSHRKVLWEVAHEVRPEGNVPIGGTFEFPIPKDAPFTGEWRGFQLRYEMRVGIDFAGGRHVSQALPVHVYRKYVPATADPARHRVRAPAEPQRGA